MLGDWSPFPPSNHPSAPHLTSSEPNAPRAPRARRPRSPILEVVLADVLLGEHERRPEKDLVWGEHLDLAQAASLERPGLGQVALDLGVGDVDRQVAEVDRVPEDELVNDTFIDVRLHLVRGREAGNGDLAPAAHLLDRLGRARQGHGGYAEDTGRVGVRLKIVLGYID